MKTISTPVLRLDEDGDYASRGGLWLCGVGFADLALPNWQEPMPKAIKLHITSNPKGEWVLQPSGVYWKNETRWVDESVFNWMEAHGLMGTRFALEMEIIEP